MSVFIGATKKKGAFIVSYDTFTFQTAMKYDSDATPNGYNSFATFSQAKSALIKRWTSSFDEYKYAIKFWKKQKSIPNT